MPSTTNLNFSFHSHAIPSYFPISFQITISTNWLATTHKGPRCSWHPIPSSMKKEQTLPGQVRLFLLLSALVAPLWAKFTSCALQETCSCISNYFREKKAFFPCSYISQTVPLLINQNKAVSVIFYWLCWMKGVTTNIFDSPNSVLLEPPPSEPFPRTVRANDAKYFSYEM